MSSYSVIAEAQACIHLINDIKSQIDLSIHSKDLSHTRFMFVLQNASNVAPGLPYLAGPMDMACGCAINDQSDICLFKLLHNLSAEYTDCEFII